MRGVPYEQEERDASTHRGVPFLRTVANVSIVAEGNPATPSNLGWPDRVGGQGAEVVVMPLNVDSGVGECVGHSSPEIAVGEERGSIHRSAYAAAS